MTTLTHDLPQRFDAHEYTTQPCNASKLLKAAGEYADEVWWKIGPAILEALLDGNAADLSEHSADFLKYLEEKWEAGNL